MLRFGKIHNTIGWALGEGSLLPLHGHTFLDILGRHAGDKGLPLTVLLYAAHGLHIKRHAKIKSMVNPCEPRWWYPGTSHVHAAVHNRILADWRRLRGLDQLRPCSGPHKPPCTAPHAR
jgi:hypothetical protein